MPAWTQEAEPETVLVPTALLRQATAERDSVDLLVIAQGAKLDTWQERWDSREAYWLEHDRIKDDTHSYILGLYKANDPGWFKRNIWTREVVFVAGVVVGAYAVDYVATQ